MHIDLDTGKKDQSRNSSRLRQVLFVVLGLIIALYFSYEREVHRRWNPVAMQTTLPSSLIQGIENPMALRSQLLVAFVTNEFGNPVPGVQVVFKTDTGKVTPSTITDDSGRATATLFPGFTEVQDIPGDNSICAYIPEENVDWTTLEPGSQERLASDEEIAGARIAIFRLIDTGGGATELVPTDLRQLASVGLSRSECIEAPVTARPDSTGVSRETKAPEAR